MEASDEIDLVKGLKSNKDITLQDDIRYSHFSIYEYDGCLDGNGYTIQLDSSIPYFVCLLTEKGVIRDCQFTGEFDVSEGVDIAVVKKNNGRIEDCESSVSIPSGNQVGGMVRDNYGIISGCKVSSKINGSGGICYRNHNVLSHNQFTGILDSDGGSGGICYKNSGVIKNCESDGEIRGGDRVGGLVAENNGEIRQCVSTSAVSGRSLIGGLVAENNGNILHCSVSATVTASKRTSGGLVGKFSDGIIENCTVEGELHGNRAVGGLVGVCLNNTHITKSFSSNTISGDNPSAFISVAGNGRIIDEIPPLKIEKCFTTASFEGDGAVIRSVESVDIESLYWSSKTLPELSAEDEVGTKVDSTTEELQTLLL